MKSSYLLVWKGLSEKIRRHPIRIAVKKTCFSLLLLLWANIVSAQTPQYSLTTGSINNSFPFNTSTSNKVQWVYYPSDFSTAPSGNITDVFFKVGSTPIGNPTFTNLTIKMGATTLSTFTSGAFTTGLTTVYTSTSQTFTGVVLGGWIQITLQTPFYYNNAQNFVVEVSQTAYSAGFTIPQTPTTTNRRMYGSVTSTTGNADGRLADFGFNILTGPVCPVPTGVASSNITMTTADFSWSAVTGSQGYEYAITTTATPPAAGTATLATSYNATGLNNGTNYWFHVRNVCTTGTSYSQWVTVPFSTVACPSVTGVTVSGITTVDANISWNTISGTLGYEYALDNSASPPASGTMQTTTAYSATSLTPGTQYYFHIRNHCTSPSNSVWTNVPFMTLACPSAGAPSIVTNVPGSVTFTWPGTSTPGVINYQYKVTTSATTPTTWLTTNNTTATDATLIPGTTYYAHVRSNCGTSSGDQYVQFINPYPPCFAPAGITISGVNMHGASIVWNSTSAGNVSGYEYVVGISAVPPTSGTATTDTFYTAVGLTANTTYYVHVRTHCGNLGNYSPWITDSFTTPATCIIYSPSNVQITNVTPHAAQITWQDYPGIYGYEYFIDNNPSSPTFAGAAVTYHVITPQNLYSGTSYYLHLRIQCDSFNYSPWLNVSFNTPAVCTAPATASVTNITSSSASFSWTPVSSAQNYEYDVSTSSTPNPSGLYTSNSNVSVNTLQPSTNYYFHVRALCSSNDVSEWKSTAFNTFATSIVTVAGNEDFSLNVYPNPAKDVLNIEVKGSMKGKRTVMLLDLSGKLIDQIQLSSDKGQLNLSNVANGLYLLRYRDNENTETMRIQKQ